MSTPGYRIKVHSSLLRPPLILGVPRKAALLNGTICAALVLGLQAWLILPLGIAFHGLMAWLTHHDPDCFEVLSRHFRQKRFYEI